MALVAATVIGGAVVLSLLLTGGDKSERVAQVGALAPAIDLPDVRAARPRVVLAALRGKPVLVNFWATWCTPCREEMPLLSAAHKRLGGKVAIVGVDVKDNRTEAVRFLADRGVDYPSAYDPASCGDSACFVSVQEAAMALGTVTHESYHLLGFRTESKVECYGMQSIRDVAVKLGRTPKEGQYLASLYWKQIYSRESLAYRMPQCRNGGEFDLRPHSGVWP